MSLNDGDDGSLLDSRRSLESVSVNSSEKLGLELHVVEVVNDGLPVGLDLAIGDLEVVAGIGGGGGSLVGPVWEDADKGERGRRSVLWT